MAKINHDGKCWDRYSYGDTQMDKNEFERFLSGEFDTRIDTLNVSGQEWDAINALANKYATDGSLSQTEFDSVVKALNNALASGDWDTRQSVENRIKQMKKDKNYKKLDANEKKTAEGLMKFQGGEGGVTNDEYNTVFNVYIIPHSKT